MAWWLPSSSSCRDLVSQTGVILSVSMKRDVDLLHAVVTFATVVVAFLALDDITTDAGPVFPLERAALVGCALWFVVVAWRLWRQGHRVLGGVSVGVVVAAVLAQPAIGMGTVPTMRWQYLAIVGGLAWFVVIAGVLARSAWRVAGRHAA